MQKGQQLIQPSFNINPILLPLITYLLGTVLSTLPLQPPPPLAHSLPSTNNTTQTTQNDIPVECYPSPTYPALSQSACQPVYTKIRTEFTGYAFDQKHGWSCDTRPHIIKKWTYQNRRDCIFELTCDYEGSHRFSQQDVWDAAFGLSNSCAKIQREGRKLIGPVRMRAMFSVRLRTKAKPADVYGVERKRKKKSSNTETEQNLEYLLP